MKTYPNSLKDRPEINQRHGIKSSLPLIKELAGLLSALFFMNEKKAILDYSERQGSKITLKNAFKDGILIFFQAQIKDSAISEDIFISKVNANPLFTSQLEALQVTIELFWKLGKILFVENNQSSSLERTGDNRFPKIVKFTTNIEFIKLVVTDNLQNEVNEFAKNVLFNWIIGEDKLSQTHALEEKLKLVFTIFSEETTYKIRKDNGDELLFQEEGIYAEILKNNLVENKDSREPVGPFRILKSFVKSDFHYFLTDKSDGFASKKSLEGLKQYAEKVSTWLDLQPKRTTIIAVEQEKDIVEIKAKNQTPARNKIYFGCPGTGKSHKLGLHTEGYKKFQTTFHPEYDYAAFVGSYKPKMIDNAINYAFSPQIFTDAYVYAYQHPDENVALLIEEINRGNCAMIFGDIFQLLDRDAQGVSQYAVRPDSDLAAYLKETLGDVFMGELKLPHNLSILATMNTSDQSLFPMDSAFKRRWEWEYIPIDLEKAAEMSFTIHEKQYNWKDFLHVVNQKIYNVTKSEDKQMGTFFVSAQKNISAEQFKNKVMYYLWFDIFKNEEPTESDYIFKFQNAGIEQAFTFSDLFKNKGNAAVLEGFLDRLGIKPIEI